MNLYKKYLEERTDKKMIEAPGGFLVYSLFPDKEVCFIEDIYTLPAFRKLGQARRLADEVTKIAKENDCKRLVCTVDPKANNSTDSIKAILAYGFNLDSNNDYLIYLVKEL